MKHRWLQELVVISALVALPVFLHGWDLTRPLHWDEADYSMACSHGWVANALDRDGTNALRHFHPPGLQYLALASFSLFGFSEVALRIPFFLLVVLVPGIAYALLRWVFSIDRPSAMTAGALVGVMSATGIVPLDARHFVLVGLTSVLVAVTAARCLTSDQPKYLFWCAGAFVLSALSMEYSVPLLCVFLGGLVVVRNSWISFRLRETRISSMLVLAAVAGVGMLVLCWPAGATHGPFNFFYYAVLYRAHGHPVEWMGAQTLHPPKWAVLWWFFVEAPVVTVLLLGSVTGACVLAWLRRGTLIGVYSVFTICLFGLGIAQHQMNINYVYYWVPAAAVQGGIVIFVISQRFKSQVPAYVALALAVSAIFYPRDVQHRHVYNAEMRALERIGVAEPLNGKRVLTVGFERVPGRFYLGGGFARPGAELVKLQDADTGRGTSSEIAWQIGDTMFPVEISPAIMRIVRLSGQRDDSLLAIDQGTKSEVLAAEFASSAYDYIVIRTPLPESTPAAELTLNEARSWRTVRTEPIGEGAAITLYARP